MGEARACPVLDTGWGCLPRHSRAWPGNPAAFTPPLDSRFHGNDIKIGGVSCFIRDYLVTRCLLFNLPDKSTDITTSVDNQIKPRVTVRARLSCSWAIRQNCVASTESAPDHAIILVINSIYFIFDILHISSSTNCHNNSSINIENVKQLTNLLTRERLNNLWNTRCSYH